MMRALSLNAALLLLVGCSLFGVEKPQTFNEGIAYAYTTETAALASIAMQVNAGQMSSADGEQLITIVERARTLTDGARATYAAGDIDNAQGKLKLVRSLLTEIDKYVRTH